MTTPPKRHTKPQQFRRAPSQAVPLPPEGNELGCAIHLTVPASQEASHTCDPSGRRDGESSRLSAQRLTGRGDYIQPSNLSITLRSAHPALRSDDLFGGPFK